jgi:hypothetical protein
MGCAIFLLATGIPLLIAMVWGTGTVWGRILLITCVLVMGVHLAAALSLNLFLNLLFSGTSSISA